MQTLDVPKAELGATQSANFKWDKIDQNLIRIVIVVEILELKYFRIRGLHLECLQIANILVV